MDNTTLSLFMHELRNQCTYVETSYRVFNQALEQRASTAVFFSAQSTLLAASQIASILWPRRARAKKRGDTIRAVLQLAEKHSLNDKRLTTLWEHDDEKLEDWIGKTKGEQIVFDHLGPVSDFASSGVDESGFYRLYDPTTMILYYRGDGYKMQTIADAISDIYSRVNTIHKQMFPEQHEPAEEALQGTPVDTATNPPSKPDVEGSSSQPDDKPKKKSGSVKKVKVARDPAGKTPATKAVKKKPTPKAKKK